jgi:predicted metal-dependent hydrolase
MRARAPKKRYLEHREAARTFVHARLEALNAHYGFSYNRVAIRDQRSRWGSCSQKKNLNFNYRLVFLPPHLADYVIVHELCHLAEFNHGPAFWDLVAQVVPQHRACRGELRTIRLR